MARVLWAGPSGTAPDSWPVLASRQQAPARPRPHRLTLRQWSRPLARVWGLLSSISIALPEQRGLSTDKPQADGRPWLFPLSQVLWCPSSLPGTAPVPSAGAAEGHAAWVSSAFAWEDCWKGGFLDWDAPLTPRLSSVLMQSEPSPLGTAL